MAASVSARSRSGGYFKLYMFVWAVAAAAALAYLASLATNPELSKSFPQQSQTEPEQSLRLASRALSEVGTVRRAVGDLQRDIGQLKENIEQRDTAEKSMQSRLAALEDRVSTIAQPPVAQNPPVATAPAKQKAADKNKQTATPPPPEPRATSRLSRLGDTPGEEDPPEATPPPRVETGSLPVEPPEPAPQATPSTPVVTFGTPVVTPSNSKRAAFGVQIGSSTSLQALRGSWSKLSSKYADALGTLEPRYMAPRGEGGKYRLVVGPFASKAEAEKVCADMGVGRAACFSTAFGGEPL